MLKTMCLLVAVMVTAVVSAEEPRFSAPEIILKGTSKTGSVGTNYLYPSPVYEDVDNDGQRELLIGDLMGNLVMYKNTSKEGLPTWGKPVSVKMAGDRFHLPNW